MSPSRVRVGYACFIAKQSHLARQGLQLLSSLFVGSLGFRFHALRLHILAAPYAVIDELFSSGLHLMDIDLLSRFLSLTTNQSETRTYRGGYRFTHAFPYPWIPLRLSRVLGSQNFVRLISDRSPQTPSALNQTCLSMNLTNFHS